MPVYVANSKSLWKNSKFRMKWIEKYVIDEGTS